MGFFSLKVNDTVGEPNCCFSRAFVFLGPFSIHPHTQIITRCFYADAFADTLSHAVALRQPNANALSQSLAIELSKPNGIPKPEALPQR
eukprot:tig00000145_g8850.t1